MCLKTLCLWNFILVMQGSSTRSTISLLLLYKFQTIILTRERAGKILNESWDSSMFPCPQMVRWSDVTNPWDVKVFLLTELYDNKVKWTVNRLIQLLPCSKVRHPENRWPADAQTAQTQQKARSRAHSSSCKSSLCCHPYPRYYGSGRAHLAECDNHTSWVLTLWPDKWCEEARYECKCLSRSFTAVPTSGKLLTPVLHSSLFNIPLTASYEHL